MMPGRGSRCGVSRPAPAPRRPLDATAAPVFDEAAHRARRYRPRAGRSRRPARKRGLGSVLFTRRGWRASVAGSRPEPEARTPPGHCERTVRAPAHQARRAARSRARRPSRSPPLSARGLPLHGLRRRRRDCSEGVDADASVAAHLDAPARKRFAWRAAATSQHAAGRCGTSRRLASGLRTCASTREREGIGQRTPPGGARVADASSRRSPALRPAAQALVAQAVHQRAEIERCSGRGATAPASCSDDVQQRVEHRAQRAAAGAHGASEGTRDGLSGTAAGRHRREVEPA